MLTALFVALAGAFILPPALAAFESNWLFTDPDQLKDGKHHKDEDSDNDEKHMKPHQTRTPNSHTPAATSPKKAVVVDP
jgi:hypothetical protein